MELLAKSLRQEVEQLGKDVRQEVEQLGKDLRQELALEVERLRHKISQDVQAVGARLDAFQAKHAGDMALLKWLLAAVITIGGGIRVRRVFLRAL